MQKKTIISDMYHHKTYMFINFQQNRVCRFVKTVHTNIFAKNSKLHKFANTNSTLKNNLSYILVINQYCYIIESYKHFLNSYY